MSFYYALDDLQDELPLTEQNDGHFQMNWRCCPRGNRLLNGYSEKAEEGRRTHRRRGVKEMEKMKRKKLLNQKQLIESSCGVHYWWFISHSTPFTPPPPSRPPTPTHPLMKHRDFHQVTVISTLIRCSSGPRVHKIPILTFNLPPSTPPPTYHS